MAESKNRYRKALSARVREEEKAGKRQEALRKKYGVSGDVSIVEKTPADVLLSVFRIFLRIAAAVLSFLFILVLLDPEMRRLFFEMPLFDFVRKLL